MKGEHGWPLDSPLSLGAGLCFLCVFLFGVLLNADPNILRPGKKLDNTKDAHTGMVLMRIFGPLSVVVLYFSWVRSNNARYAYLD